ncbi:HAD-like protein, partial [Massarina eburnea CBS 473.64]
KPIFLVRDPIRIFASWKLHGWSTLQSLVDRFEGLFTSIDSHPTPPYTLVCEKLVRDPEAEIRRVCEYWGIDFNAAMLDYGKDVEDPLELLDAVKEHYGMRSDVPPQAILSNQERYDIECKLGPLYLRTWQPEIDKIRPVLDKATWFAFDLDDTLHEFRRVSMGAIGSVLNSVIQETGSSYPSLTLPTLKSECAKVLMSTASPEFVKDKTSHQYHMHHVRSVFAAFDLTFPDDTIAAWASHYEAVHMETLELKCGVVDLFTTLKSLGKKIVIIGEGPQDMQEWTLEKFGLNQFVDYLATTNELGVGKTDGLFPKVLEAIGAQGSDVVMVGDNYDRDVLPAREAGMFPVHYAEKENFWVGKEADGEATSVKVNTLKKLEFML